MSVVPELYWSKCFTTQTDKEGKEVNEAECILFITECMKRDIRQSRVSFDKVRCTMNSRKTPLNRVHHILLTGCTLGNAQCDKHAQQHMAAVSKNLQMWNASVHILKKQTTV